MAKGKGSIYALFVKAGVAPSNPELSAEYTLVGNRKGTGLSMTAAPVDLTDSENAAMEYVPGIPGYEINGTFNTDHAGDGGENILRTALKTQAAVYWLLTPVDTSGAQDAGKLQHYGNGPVGDCSYNHPHEAPSELTVRISVNGQFTTDTVAT